MCYQIVDLLKMCLFAYTNSRFPPNDANHASFQNQASIGSELTNADDNVKENNPGETITAVKYTAWFVGCLILFLAIARGLAQMVFRWRANRKSEVDTARDNEVEEML
jgi:hypothetical protein